LSRPAADHHRIATVCVRTGPRHAHAGELGFRDFSSLFPLKENRRQSGNPACRIFKLINNLARYNRRTCDPLCRACDEFRSNQGSCVRLREPSVVTPGWASAYTVGCFFSVHRFTRLIETADSISFITPAGLISKELPAKCVPWLKLRTAIFGWELRPAYFDSMESDFNSTNRNRDRPFHDVT